MTTCQPQTMPIGMVEVIELDSESIQLFCSQVCDGDEAVMTELMTMYLQSLDNLVKEMEEALHGKNLKLLRRAAHTLKSSSRIFGAEQLSNNCARLEEMALAENLLQAPTLVHRIALQSQQMHKILPAEFRRLNHL